MYLYKIVCVFQMSYLQVYTFPTMKLMYSLEVPVCSFLAECPSTQVRDSNCFFFIVMSSIQMFCPTFLVHTKDSVVKWSTWWNYSLKASGASVMFICFLRQETLLLIVFLQLFWCTPEGAMKWLRTLFLFTQVYKWVSVNC